MSQTNRSRSPKQKNTRVPARVPSTAPASTVAPPTATIEQSDLSGLLLIAFSSALFLSLLSAVRPSNWIGPVGAFFSDLLLDFVGIGAYPIVLGMLALSFVWLSGKTYTPALRSSLYFLALFVCSLSLLSLLTESQFQKHPIGGWVGTSIRDLSVSLFSFVGSTIVLSTFFLASLFLFANWKLRRVVRILGTTGGFVGTPIFWMARGVRDAVTEAREAWSQRAQQAEEHNDDDSDEEEEQDELASTPTRAFDTARRNHDLVHISSLAPTSKVLENGHSAQRNVVVQPARPEPVFAEPETLDIEDEDDNIVQTQAPIHVHAKSSASPEVVIEQSKSALPKETSETTATKAHAHISQPIEPALMPPMPKTAVITAETPVAIAATALGVSTETMTVSPTPETAMETSPVAVDKKIEASAPTPTATPKKSEAPVLTIVEPKARQKLVIPNEDQPREVKEYQLPPLSFLDYKEPESRALDKDVLTANARKLEQKLLDYHIPGNVVEIHPGPVITMYEFAPGPGIKVSRIASLTDDLAMALEAERVRIIAPIPGKSVVGIEIPNSYRETVYLKEILADQSFKKVGSGLALGLGKDVAGNARSTDLAKMPHLLVAGATGSGKSVAVNTMICSILFNATPQEVRFLMIDPKMLELSIYEGIPHLLLPVVTDMKKAALALRWAVDEMERRYQLLAEAGVRNIANYNKKIELQKLEAEQPQEEGAEKGSLADKDPLPYIVVIIDELADLMMVASRDVETSIARLAQMARAAGIHLILATQRPSVDVITGLIKANFPTRMSFQVASKIDSRTILDQQGAENLLGMGDMLLMERGKMVRLHGALVLEEEIHTLVEFLKTQGTPKYDESILAPRDEDGEVIEGGDDDEKDALYDQALAIVLDTKQASTSMVQRRLRIGYNRAARIIEQMERDGIVGPADGAKPREVLYRAAE